jgi:hypothetical protein
MGGLLLATLRASRVARQALVISHELPNDVDHGT